MVDKNLFVHDLSVVTIIKNEGRYLKEWLDYHLAAGVDHFYLYDNDSDDDTREVLRPYAEENLVNYFVVPGELAQMPAYNDAVRRFRFATRYMAFIDCDEFIFPKNGQGITEVVDEVLSAKPQAAGLAINWQIFGSNNLETVDYSKGVLERFTRRAPSDWFEPPTPTTLPVGNIHIKTIANPRFVRYIVNPHYAYYFEGKFAVNTAGERVTHWGNEPVLADKLVVNHYITKSKEEFQNKMGRGRTGVDAKEIDTVDMSAFEKNDRNDELDEDILTYRELRADSRPPQINFDAEHYYKTLEETLSRAVHDNTPQEYFEDKLETFLTCRALAGMLRRRFPNDKRGYSLEEAALQAINRAHATPLTLPEVMLTLNALTPILVLPYPVVEDIRKNCIDFVKQLISDLRRNSRWEPFVEMNDYLDLLMAFGAKIQS